MNRNLKNIIMIAIIVLMSLAIYLTIKSSSNNSSMNVGIPPERTNVDSTNIGDTSNSIPPSMPDESGNESSSSMPENGMPPERLDGGDSSFPPDMPGGSSTSTITYVLLGFESLVISSTCIYLVMSSFNKKTFKETFEDKDKLIIGGLLTIIVTGGLTYLCTTFIDKSTSSLNGIQGENHKDIDGNSTNITYSASKEITSDEIITEGTFTSTNASENAINISGDIDVKLSDIVISKSGDSNSGDSTSFYGNNSGILAKDGATVTISNATINTMANGANGVFSYGGSASTNNENTDGTTINISNSKIVTTGNNAGGIMTTGGGIMNATNLEIETSGTSSAAIRSDRGGGLVNVTKGTYKTTGQGSPAIYSTADITVNYASLISTASEGVVIEGANSVTLNNCELTDTNNKLNGQSTTYKNIFLYQSMSGDAKEGGSSFTAKDSLITTNKGDSFYVTNTMATINLTNNTIINNDSNGYFLRSQADSWGNSGSNGGNVTLNMTNQKANGNIYIDDISMLTMNMTSSNYEGAINKENIAKSVTIKLDSSSNIKLTADSYITSLEDEDKTYSNIDLNGYKLYINGNELIK